MSRPSNPPIFAARASLPYRLALGLVAVVMAVLPCVYVALTALTAWGTYLFATRYFVAIWQWPTGYNRGAVIVKVLCSCTPVLTGGTAAFFMVKPLFARRPARTQPLTLTPQAEPRVHALVQEVCRAAGGGPGGHGQGADDCLRPDPISGQGAGIGSRPEPKTPPDAFLGLASDAANRVKTDSFRELKSAAGANGIRGRDERTTTHLPGR